MNTMLLTVVGPRDRADVMALADTPVCELLASFAQLTAGATATLTGWELAQPSGGPLPGYRTLAEAGVVDGAILHLRPAGAPHLEPVVARARLHARGDGRGPLQRTRDALPEWVPRSERVVPALKATRRRGRDADMGRVERARASWGSADYELRLDAQLRALRLRRSVTIAVAADAPGAGTSTVTALLGTLFAHVARERPVVVERAADVEPPQRPPTGRTVVLRDCGTGVGGAAVARADQLVLVVDGRAPATALHSQITDAIAAGAPPVVVVVNRLARGVLAAEPETVERGFPDARGVLGVHHDARRAARVAEGTFSWAEKTGRWGIELRELAVLLSADWTRLGLAAPPLRT